MQVKPKHLKELYLNMFKLIKLIKNLINLDYRVRRLERAKYWREKYNGTKEKRT